MEPIYLDNNATTALLPAVAEAMRPYLGGFVGNPASSHRVGRQARRALETARERTAGLLGAHPDELVFTSGATEANNLALLGLVGALPGQLLVAEIEHPSVLEPLRWLGRHGHRVETVPIEPSGLLCPERLAALVTQETRLVSVQLANHETGVLQPISELVATVGGRAPFHCDAVQAVGKRPLDFHALGVTALVISAHKFHGPVGVGALVLRRGVELQPLFFGGHQQQGRRPGTEAVAGPVGLAAALELAVRELTERDTTVRRLRERFLERLRQEAAPFTLNGPEAGGMPHTLNVSFVGCRSDSLVMTLDLAGVACSAGSACASGSLRASPVLRAMGVAPEALNSAVRFSLSAMLTDEDVTEAARRIGTVVRRLRSDLS